MRTEEILGEILGHSDFDGHGWADGDLVVFEDGTGALIEKCDQFHVWSEPKPLPLPDVLSVLRDQGDSWVANREIDSYETLFALFLVPAPKQRWWRADFS